MSEFSPEDAKLVTLAKSARARAAAEEGAAVRDDDGRSYTGVTVAQPSFKMSALQLAVANAVAAGASTLEAAVVVTASSDVDSAPVADLTPDAPLIVVAP